MSIPSLKFICLKYIKDNFSFFMSIYRKTENENVKMDFIFLQLRFSQVLLDMFIDSEGETSAMEYFDFLLNKYIVDLDLDFLMNYLDRETILKKVIPIAPNLQKLSLDTGHTSNDASLLLESLIPHLASVRYIIIFEICTDKMLELIGSSCPALTGLDIEGSLVTGEGMKALCKDSNGLIQANSKIKHLNLFQTPLVVADVVFLLRYMPNLVIIEYDNLYFVMHSLYFHVNDSNLQHATRLKIENLTFIESNPQERSRLLNIFSRTFLNLKTLHTEVSNEEELSLIEDFQHVENLKLLCTRSLFSLNNFLVRNGPKFKSLSLECYSLSVTVLIENCPNLEDLYLSNISYEKLDKNPAKLLNSLRSLELMRYEDSPRRNTEAESTAVLLNSCPNVNMLSFAYIELFDKDSFKKEMLKFSLNSGLKYLSFDSCNVDIDFVEQLVLDSKSLSTLNIYDCELDIADLQERINDADRKIEVLSLRIKQWQNV